MRGYVKFISAVMAFFILAAGAGISRAAPADFQDVAGHWAEATLRQAYNDGIIVGEGNLLSPDANTSAAQVLAIICRVLGAELSADISGWGLSKSAWYYDYVAKAAYMGLISSADKKDLLAPISRENAFCLLAEAFALVEVKPDLSVLDKYTDSGLIKDTRRQAMASLVSQGLIAGYGGRLHVNGYATRAEVLSLLYRIVGEYLPASDADGDYEHGVVLQGPAELSGNSFSKGVWFDCTVSDVVLNGVNAERVGIRSHVLNSLSIGESTHIKNLTLATQSGDITITVPENGAVVDTLVVGAGNGQVTVSGTDIVEVTGNGRRVVITGNAEKVVVSGRNNSISIRKGVQVGKIELLRSAPDSRVNIEGNVQELEIIGLRAAIVGSGYAGTLTLSRNHARVNVDYGKILDTIDQGIIDASVKISLPKKLPAGDILYATALIENAAPGKKCALTWYVNDVQVKETMIETGKELPKLSHSFTYSRDMQDSADVRACIKYVTAQGERQEVSAVGTVGLENYNKQHWMQLDAQRVLNKVTTDYKGDYTLKWALQNDLDEFDKEVWVNAKGYTSNSEYLLWVNIAYQRVNVFKDSAGSWELIRTCIVGTGAKNSPTRRGVTAVTYKQFYGWTTGAYTVKPVVRFWPRSGFAFHSRIFYPNTSTLRDESIGFPVSHGCIRMYDDDIWYLYNNIPEGSTVVVY